MNRDARIFVAGHRGMVGSAIVRRLQALGYTNLITRGREELDLVDQAAVNAFFAENRIDQVYMASAKVGGIHANNTYPAEFIYQNLMVEANIIHAAHVNEASAAQPAFQRRHRGQEPDVAHLRITVFG